MNKEEIYKHFAKIYDQVNSLEFYRNYQKFVKEAIDKYGDFADVKILDLACGTGTLINLLNKDNKNIVGVDASREMLEIAEQKNPNIKFYQQEMEKLDLDEKFNVVTSTYDSLNYIFDQQTLAKAFINISKHLEDGGLFIFDFNTEFKEVPAVINKGNAIYRSKIEDDIWEVEIEINDQGNKYLENHKEKLYQYQTIKEKLIKADFEIMAWYSDFNIKISKPDDQQRLFVVAKKKVWVMIKEIGVLGINYKMTLKVNFILKAA